MFNLWSLAQHDVARNARVNDALLKTPINWAKNSTITTDTTLIHRFVCCIMDNEGAMTNINPEFSASEPYFSTPDLTALNGSPSAATAVESMPTESDMDIEELQGIRYSERRALAGKMAGTNLHKLSSASPMPVALKKRKKREHSLSSQSSEKPRAVKPEVGPVGTVQPPSSRSLSPESAIHDMRPPPPSPYVYSESYTVTFSSEDTNVLARVLGRKLELPTSAIWRLWTTQR